MSDAGRTTKVGRVAGAAGRRPDGPLALLELALLASAGTAALVLTRHLLIAGVVALIGAVALLSGAARARESGGRRERLTELVADRLFDAGVLAPVAWVTRASSPRVAALALFALGASFVASYERARGQSLGYRGSEGLGYRAGRDALLVAGLLTGWLEATLWAFVAASSAAVLVRAWNVRLQERRAPGRRPAAT